MQEREIFHCKNGNCVAVGSERVKRLLVTGPMLIDYPPGIGKENLNAKREPKWNKLETVWETKALKQQENISIFVCRRLLRTLSEP